MKNYSIQARKKLFTKIVFAVSGLLLCGFLFLTPAIIHAAQNGDAICTAQTNAATNLGTCVNRIYLISLTVGGVLAVLIFVIAGYMYISGGTAAKAAKTMMESAIAGLIILFATFLILNTLNPDLTTFTGLTLPNITCNGTGQDLNKNICAAPSSALSTTGAGGTGTGTPSSNTITITGKVSSNNNVALHGSITAQTTNSSFIWKWTSNGTTLTDASGGAATSQDIDTTMDDNSAGTHTDVVVATASGSGNGDAASYTGTATFTIVFDDDGDAVSVSNGSTTSSGAIGCSNCVDLSKQGLPTQNGKSINASQTLVGPLKAMQSQLGSLSWYITAGVEPGHLSGCHTDGSCVDIGTASKTDPNTWSQICKAASAAGFKKVLNEATASATGCPTYKTYSSTDGQNIHIQY